MAAAGAKMRLQPPIMKEHWIDENGLRREAAGLGAWADRWCFALVRFQAIKARY
jgi:hypothetical protein